MYVDPWHYTLFDGGDYVWKLDTFSQGGSVVMGSPRQLLFVGNYDFQAYTGIS